MKVELLGYLTNEGKITTKEELEEITIQSFPMVSVPVDAEIIYKCKGCVPEVYKNDCNFWWNYKENSWQEPFHNVKQSNPNFYKIIWRNNMQEHKTYISAIGKLYKEVQDNAQLDKAVIALYSALEFEIKTGQKLPIKIKAEEVRELSSKDIDYVQDSLYSLGCKGDFLFEKKSCGKIEYVLEGLV